MKKPKAKVDAANSPIDPEQFEAAKKAASMFVAQMIAMPPQVQLMTVDMMMKAIFMSNVKVPHRLRVFDHFIKTARVEIKDSVKPGAKNG